MTRKFSSISIATNLSSSLDESATSMVVTTGTGSALMGGVVLAAGNVDQFTVVLDPDTINEELVAITAASSDTFTIVRGQAGTSAVSHTNGAVVRHVLTGDDLTAFETASQSIDAKIDESVFTAKGDLIVGTGDETYEAVSVGVDGLVLGASSSSPAGVAWINPGDAAPIVIDTKTSSYTLVLSDAGKNIEFNSASATTLTVPTNAAVAFPVGTALLVTQVGAGQVTIAGASGVTIQSSYSRTKLSAQYAQASLIKRATNTWLLAGNLSS